MRCSGTFPDGDSSGSVIMANKKKNHTEVVSRKPASVKLDDSNKKKGKSQASIIGILANGGDGPLVAGHNHGQKNAQTNKPEIQIHLKVAVVGLLDSFRRHVPDSLETFAHPEALEPGPDKRIATDRQDRFPDCRAARNRRIAAQRLDNSTPRT